MFNEHFRRALIDCDVALVRRMWIHIAPHLPQPNSDEQALAEIHAARTGASSIGFNHRAYSHSWLIERGLPSMLPDDLKPKAERMYPRVVDAVGIGVKAAPEKHDMGKALMRAMSDAVADCYANGDRDPALVKARMMESRRKVYRGA